MYITIDDLVIKSQLILFSISKKEQEKVNEKKKEKIKPNKFY